MNQNQKSSSVTSISMLPKSLNDADLERLAAEEIVKETKKAASRAESFGSIAWRPSPLAKPNKLFLARAIGGSVIQNAWRNAHQTSTNSRSPSGSSKDDHTSHRPDREHNLGSERSSGRSGNSSRSSRDCYSKSSSDSKRCGNRMEELKRGIPADKLERRRSRSPFESKTTARVERKSRREESRKNHR